jgi:hypothetical protein
MANEIGLLHKFSNTIRRASKETQDVKAAKIFRIRDDDGNDAEPFLQELFANYIRDMFPEVKDNIRQRLAGTMLLRRKRILYRRNRYGKTIIRPQEVPSQPSIARPRVGTTSIQPREPAEQQATATPSRSVVQSLAQTATTLSPDSFQKASSPSVVSVSKTIALGNHEELAFPPAPCGGLLQKYRQLRKQREEKHRAFLESLTGYEENYGQPTPSMDLTSATEANHRKILEQDWNDCLRAIGEVTCPFCFYALPAQDAIDEKKWKYVMSRALTPRLHSHIHIICSSRQIQSLTTIGYMSRMTSMPTCVYLRSVTHRKNYTTTATHGSNTCVNTPCVGAAPRNPTWGSWEPLGMSISHI